jgi:hypothetical protein
VIRLLRVLLQSLAAPGGGDSAPEVVFVHCMGGHGRTGVLVALLLGASVVLCRCACRTDVKRPRAVRQPMFTRCAATKR